MNKPQALALLELIADLYRLANAPDDSPAPAASGVGDVGDAARLDAFSDIEGFHRVAGKS